MKDVSHWLGLLLVVCVAVRIAAWLITPAIPLLVALFVISLILTRLFRHH